MDTSIANRIQKMEDRIIGVNDTIEETDTSVKENAKSKKFLTQNSQEIWDAMKRPNLRIGGLEEGEDSVLQGTDIFNEKHRRKLCLSKERDAYKHARRL